MINKPLFSIQFGNRVFKPKLLPSLAFVLVLPALIHLGFWQLDRAQQKRDIIANLESKSSLAVVSLMEAFKHKNPDQLPVKLSGQAIGKFSIITDNQKQGNRLGYEVFSLFKADSFETPILISRGWLPRKDFYQKVPQVPVFDDRHINGVIYTSKGSNPVIATNAVWERFADSYLIGQFDLQTIREKVSKMGYDSADFVVRQKAELDSPFVRQWSLIASPPQKHTAYAIQWFAMALTLCIIFIVVNSKKVIRE